MMSEREIMNRGDFSKGLVISVKVLYCSKGMALHRGLFSNYKYISNSILLVPRPFI